MITGLVPLLLLGWSCDIKKSDLEPEASFIRVYESGITDESYYPKDLIQLADGNYLVLSALTDSNQSLSMSYPPVSVIALEEDGNVITRETLPVKYSNPVPGLFNLKGNISFVCMDDITNKAVLMKVEVSSNGMSITEQGELENDFPLYAYSDGDNLVLLSYDSWGASVITKYDGGLNSQWEASFTIANDLLPKVMDHLLLNKQKPYFIGQLKNDDGSGDYMVNCFEGSSLALLFFNGSSGSYNPGTGIYSFQEETGLTAALHQSGNIISLARYHSGNSYVYPHAIVNRDELISTKEMEDILISQLRAEAPMDIVMYEHHDQMYISYASTTKSNQILLLFFNAETGIQEYSHTLGFGNPVEVTNIITTLDGGLAVLGKTWINSQYQRIIFYKLDKEQLLFEEDE